MNTKVFGAAVFAALAAGVVVALRRFGPEPAGRGEDSEAGNVGEEQKRQALAATT